MSEIHSRIDISLIALKLERSRLRNWKGSIERRQLECERHDEVKGM